MAIKTNELKTKIKGAILEVTLDRPKANHTTPVIKMEINETDARLMERPMALLVNKGVFVFKPEPSVELQMYTSVDTWDYDRPQCQNTASVAA